MSEQLQITSSGVPTYAQVLDELNALRTILLGPKIGTRLLLDGRTRERISGHLYRIQLIAHDASRVVSRLEDAPPPKGMVI